MSNIIPFSAPVRPLVPPPVSPSLPQPSGLPPQGLSLSEWRTQTIHDALHSPRIARLEKQNARLRAELARLKGTIKRGEA